MKPFHIFDFTGSKRPEPPATTKLHHDLIRRTASERLNTYFTMIETDGIERVALAWDLMPPLLSAMGSSHNLFLFIDFHSYDLHFDIRGLCANLFGGQSYKGNWLVETEWLIYPDYDAEAVAREGKQLPHDNNHVHMLGYNLSSSDPSEPILKAAVAQFKSAHADEIPQ